MLTKTLAGISILIMLAVYLIAVALEELRPAD